MKSFSQLLLEKNNKSSSKKGISDSEINKRLSASTTKGDQARSQYDADGGYGDSNVGDATTNKSLKKGKPFTKAQSDAIQSKSTLNKSKKYASGEYPKIGGGERMSPKSKGPGASTGKTNTPPATVGGKSKGTTPVKVNITKPVKQSEVSKKAKEFTSKINKRRANRIKDATGGKKTGSLRKGNLSFAGDRSGEYKRVKTDIETKNLLKKAGGSGDIGFTAPDRKTKVTKRIVRAVKQGTPDPFTTPKPKKPIAPFGTKKVTTSAPEFGKGDTKGQMNVKAMDKKTFKVTQPKDVKLPKSFTDFSKKIKYYRAGIEIEKKVNQPSYQIKSKGSGASTGGSSSSSGGGRRINKKFSQGNTSNQTSGGFSGGGYKPPKTPKGSALGFPNPPEDGTFKGEIPKKPKVTGDAFDNLRNRTKTQFGRIRNTAAFDKRVSRMRNMKAGLPKSMKALRPLKRFAAKNPRAALALGAVGLIGTVAGVNKLKPKKAGPLNAFRNSTYDKTVYHAKGPKAGDPVEYTYRAKNSNINPPGIGPASKAQTQRTLNKGIKSGKFKLK